MLDVGSFWYIFNTRGRVWLEFFNGQGFLAFASKRQSILNVNLSWYFLRGGVQLEVPVAIFASSFLPAASQQHFHRKSVAKLRATLEVSSVHACEEQGGLEHARQAHCCTAEKYALFVSRKLCARESPKKACMCAFEHVVRIVHSRVPCEL